MPKNEKPTRLKKRQKKYLEQFNVFTNAQKEDPLYAEKKAVSEALHALNQKLEELVANLTDKPANDGKEIHSVRLVKK